MTKFLAPLGGFEPLTYRLGGGCSIQLSYKGLSICFFIIDEIPISVKNSSTISLCLHIYWEWCFLKKGGIAMHHFNHLWAEEDIDDFIFAGEEYVISDR